MIEIDGAWLSRHPLPEVGGETDKNERGRVLVAGGSESVPGAPLLTGEAALRVGAGKVQLATVERAALTLGVQMPEAAVFGLAVNEHGELGSGAIDKLVDRIQHCDAAVIGPGMGPKAGSSEILKALVSERRGDAALLLDAGMIPAANLLEHTHAWAGRRVLTPHFGEMAALNGCRESEVSFQSAQDAATRLQSVVVLKSSETWIASPDKPMLHYGGGGPGLATGGSGDVLAGAISGLLARGMTPRDAAAWGVWLHGEAGKQLSNGVGSLGFLARELLPILPSFLERESKRHEVGLG